MCIYTVIAADDDQYFLSLFFKNLYYIYTGIAADVSH